MEGQHASYPQPVEIARGVFLIDLMELGMRYRTCAYLVRDREPLLIETGSARSHDALLAGLRALGLTPTDLAYVAVTHVHLDHAGGAGQFMKLAPQAKLLVHPRGARHLIDPSRLYQGAREVYGERLDQLFGPLEPVPAEQVQAMPHESELVIGERRLQFLDAPGHASHHFAIVDPVSNGIFTGDSAGLRFVKGFTGFPYEFVMPSTSPVDFDPEAVHRTCEMFAKLPMETVYQAHFGPSPKDEALRETVYYADRFRELIERTFDDHPSPEALVQAQADIVRERLGELGLDASVFRPQAIQLDLTLNALGLLAYESRRRRKMGSAG
ncbi:MBL fold metallo-hydrolase [Alicyclobacillus acidocaldarius]|uniref:Beta-lactamase domain protein n=1 Tax=Alicyclobacillus acidocaldarius (strain Tc-4-1) TaxID=1048834 RepID=F8IGB9_ALIAT|nr:MBL fold metallo-hydrolase [Alicyclobacillus acidocaldarius]AEJ43015.1 beta-lactamase domain protein [Alicyclobacillus acidocaldarius subsp. acidocaldarius Tc-4-1]